MQIDHASNHIPDDEITAIEEEKIDNDPLLHQGILEAKAAYAAGDFITLDEYITKQDGAT